MSKIILVGAGGFIGAILRYVISGFMQSYMQDNYFPYGTLAVNIAGCFLIGIFSYLIESQVTVTAEMRLLIMVGLLGSFTTYSTFSDETMNMLQNQRIYIAFINIGAHVIIGLSAVLIGRFTVATIMDLKLLK